MYCNVCMRIDDLTHAVHTMASPKKGLYLQHSTMLKQLMLFALLMVLRLKVIIIYFTEYLVMN